ncbi:GNAT family N-acetyltransferase [Kutzneria kofuensis]|uniref:GNAT superfamily N-acetyltransferase n=1 Tax=Kutzneria kofuensis TaxID=103725 RepID=A0A7W9KS27_9PSEU|nr:GNAT family N-acetyltransferase [Kutzneria kofuensis]MBB5897677.1 GNAT superfamily N-acetyltransferase [Kutzneria kofuensis]
MTWTVEAVDPNGPVGASLLREYYTEIVARYWGRPALRSEVEQVLLEEPSDDLVPPTGLLLAASHDGELGGCGGFRVLSPGVAELTRVFLRPSMRGRGGGVALLTALERAAVGMGLTTARLDTRKDLVEARRLYARNGYVEIPAYNSSPYADHWFEKRLA